MEKSLERVIVESWRKNATPWVKAIANGEIESRVASTNQAILESVIKKEPKNLLDIGCGEGWLIREVLKTSIKDVSCTGIDVVPDFRDYVEESGGKFLELSYEDYSTESFPENFDVIVSNFSLLGKDSVENVVRHSLNNLAPKGFMIVQTLHPEVASVSNSYKDGWREGNWDGFSEEFVEPAPWYFRTIDSWRLLFERSGFEELVVQEPVHPKSGLKMSVLFEARRGI
ncbi:MAG: class I SAM-dependent methyltransferase [Gammaproteobacteria bacterium]|nr:class I SAM-dependent methyltransferase [Gammaproteobacteria bacterium]